MDSNPPPRRRKTRSDLVHLRSLLSVQPATSTGQLPGSWGEIEAGPGEGNETEIWGGAAKLDGLEIPYSQFRVYVSRLRRRRQRSSTSAQQPSPAVVNGERGLPLPASPPPDPFNNLREQREKRNNASTGLWLYPFVRLIEVAGGVYSEAERFLAVLHVGEMPRYGCREVAPTVGYNFQIDRPATEITAYSQPVGGAFSNHPRFSVAPLAAERLLAAHSQSTGKHLLTVEP